MNTVKPKKKAQPAPKGDVSLAQAISNLKDEILSEVRLVSTGAKYSIYELTEKGKQLVSLEEQFKKDKNVAAPAAKQSSEDDDSEINSNAGPICADDF